MLLIIGGVIEIEIKEILRITVSCIIKVEFCLIYGHPVIVNDSK